MQKITGFLSQRPFRTAFSLVFFLFVFELAVFKPYFIANDDACALMIYKGLGVALQPDEHVMYINVLLGLLFKHLYSSFPSISWYGGFFVLVEFLAWGSFLSALLLKSRHPFSAVLFGILFFSIGQFFFLRFSYTIVATLAFMGGVALLGVLPGLKAVPLRRWALFFSCTCLLLSSLIRFGAFCYDLLCALPLLAVLWIEYPRKTKVLLAASAFGILLLCAPLFEEIYYRQDPTWKEFRSFYYQGEMRALDLNDPQAMVYSPTTKALFDRMGWSANDFELLKFWYFLDKDKYSTQNLQQIGAAFEHKRFLGGVEFLGMFLEPFPLQVLICFAALVPFCPRSKLGLILGYAFWIFLVIYLQKSLAKAPPWIFFPELASLPLLALFSAVPPPTPGSKPDKKAVPFLGRAALGFVALLALLAVSNVIEGKIYDEDCGGREKLFKADLAQLNPQDDQLFTAWGATFPYEIPGVFDSFDSFHSFHLFSVMGFQRAPFSQALLDHFHTENPFREMVDNPRRLLICSPVQGMLYVQYMKERFNLQVRAQKVFKGSTFSAYAIHALK